MTINKSMLVTNIRELKKSGYQSRSIKEEIRQNLLKKLGKGEPVFSGIFGFEDTVIPDIERALLSRHNINLLGLRGQAKTRIAREMTSLLDEYIPIVKGSELNDDPMNPLTSFAKNLIAEMGDDTPIIWLHRSDRYIEKLATPDVSVADLIGDVDPIKAVNLKLNYSDERVIHFGLIPRSNRSIFVINELPDLQARIQVALFNILQEGDIQIRGFKLRLPLDIQFVFTANPEDYTNRGSIVTPLKDRIGSQILTHYPKDVATASKITIQEARITQQQKDTVETHPLLTELIEQISFEARVNEYVDPKSGVSARLSISAYENLISSAERRAVMTRERQTRVRISDLYGVIPSITGKVEMVYEGEQEGPFNVANILIGKSIRTTFGKYFPVPEESKRKPEKRPADPYKRITGWFEKGNTLDLLYDLSDKEYARNLNQVDGLVAVVDEYMTKIGKAEKYLWMEFLLHGLAEHSKLGKAGLDRGARFKDLLGSMFSNFDD